jgi:hypothetical protein
MGFSSLQLIEFAALLWLFVVVVDGILSVFKKTGYKGWIASVLEDTFIMGTFFAIIALIIWGLDKLPIINNV